MAEAQVERVVLEMSLKPFTSLTQEAIETVCRQALQQWHPLTKIAQECGILLWVADGSEILTWQGDLDSEIEWARYIGFANSQYRPYAGHTADPRRIAVPYTEQPVRFTNRDLQTIIRTFKRIGQQEFGLRVVVGATFDPGPEFANSRFKFALHPEIMGRGEEANLGTLIWMVRAWSKLNGDPTPYAGYPHGIPAGTPFGEFLGRQCQSYLTALGFDYIWFSNGFGFSHFGWSPFGEAFDGQTFGRVPYRKIADAILEFWEQFRRHCSYPVEVRGTNFSTGIDVVSDCVPAIEIYDRGYISTPPPNSPWGALNQDFGLEMMGYMSRIAHISAPNFPFRYYPNDPWFWQNPWWDLYGREPFDIYMPLSVSRINSAGAVETPKLIEFLTIDTEKGELNERCPMEVIPHVRRALDDAPDAPGPLVWLYPFREYHRIAEEHVDRHSAIYLGDWFICDAINHGFPLNTVISTENLAGALASGALKDAILVTPTTILPGTYENTLVDFVTQGGKLLLYGPMEKAPATLCELAGINLLPGLAGDFSVRSTLTPDEFTWGNSERLLHHGADLSGGPICEAAGERAQALITVVQGNQERAYATCRTEPEWRGGKVAWIRGSASFAVPRPGVKRDCPSDTFWQSGALARQLLQAFDIRLQQVCSTPQTRQVLLCVSRKRNAFWFTGVKPDTTVLVRMAFPDGAPVLVQNEAIVQDGMATYQLKKSFHEECVAFVRQHEASVLSCREQPPFPSGRQRRLHIAGLVNATVTLYPPRERWGECELLCQGKTLMPEYDEVAGCLRVHGVTGMLDVNW